MQNRPDSAAFRKRHWIRGVSDPATPVKTKYTVIPLGEGVACDRPQNEAGDGFDHTRVIREGVGGLLVAFARVCTPLHTVFPKGSPEYEARIQAQIDRVEREMAKQPPSSPRAADYAPGTANSVLGALPKGTKWTDLRVCYCRGCGIRLLGESQEVLRRVAIRFAMRCVPHLPPPVAARVDGVPYCGECRDDHVGSEQDGRRAGPGQGGDQRDGRDGLGDGRGGGPRQGPPRVRRAPDGRFLKGGTPGPQ